ncbi:MAG: hypothetical protein IJC39_00890 [Firmicutes bacterium]|nr:hypothetical protein [Bacillota bacterium]
MIADFFGKRRKKEHTVEGLRKKLLRERIIFFAILTILGVYIYNNIDYFVFKHLISGNYIFTDALDELYERELGKNVEGKYYRYFDNVVISATTRALRDVNQDWYTFQYFPQEIEQRNENRRITGEASFFEMLPEQVGYFRLCNYSAYSMKIFEQSIRDMKEADDLIIDLRGNSGGMLPDMHDMAEYFLDEGMVISQEITRNEIFSKTYKASRKRELDFGKIIILQDSSTASASEGFIGALCDNLDNVTVIGSLSFGKGIGQITMPLRGGYAINATVLKWLSPSGFEVHKAGVVPDVEYETEGNDIIEFAYKTILEGRADIK